MLNRINFLHSLLDADPRPPIGSVEVSLDARAKQLELVIIGRPTILPLNSRIDINQLAHIDTHEQHAQRIRIAQKPISPVPTQQLGRGKRTRADLGFLERADAAAEIDEFYRIVRRDEDIESVEIAVGEVEGVDVREAIEELVVPGYPDGGGRLGADFREKGLAVDLLEDHANALDAADKSDNIAVSADRAIDTQFGEELGDDIGSIGVDVAVDFHAKGFGAFDDASEERSRRTALEGD